MMTTQTVQIGSFFEESWGYDQTNVDFYQVVKVSASGKTVWLRHVGCSLTEDRKLVPNVDDFDRVGAGSKRDGLLKRSLRQSSTYKEWSVNMTSYSNAYLWDGTPAYDTIASGAPGH